MSKLIQYIVVCLTAFLLSGTLLAQEQTTGVNADVKAEMEATYGVYPEFMQALPDHLQAAAWELMKAAQSPEAALSAKNSELIGLGVSAQVPCDYCVYFHTQMAKMLGATDAEIKETIAKAADTRYWSTLLNGSDTDFENFKSEVDRMVAFVQQQEETKQTTKK